MAIEAGLLTQIASKDPLTVGVLGAWDYLSHQLAASPFRPVYYIDRMDLFGYRYILGHQPTRSAYLVGEVKKDEASIGDVDQLLKYVDWVRDEYCFGDYSMIHAFLVAYGFSSAVVQHRDSVSVRQYTIGVRPVTATKWSRLSLVSYRFDRETGRLRFSEVQPPPAT